MIRIFEESLNIFLVKYLTFFRIEKKVKVFQSYNVIKIIDSFRIF
jgi:hypothetical protein